jgi:hypothetical protein
MRLKIDLVMDNAAFDDDHRQEAARILKRLAERIQKNTDKTFHLADINGNNVGKAEFKGSRR